MHYIRQNACRGIKAAQVISFVGVSRTTLESHFIQELGCSVHDQLHMAKLNRATSLVRSISISFEEIAELCGYVSVQYMYAVFRRNVGLTPRDYRYGCESKVESIDSYFFIRCSYSLKHLMF